MPMGESTEGKGTLIQLEEKEGGRELSDDYIVRTIGVPVPLVSSQAAFDEDNPPAQGLAVSERLGLIFVAHHGGFFMAGTKDVLSLAKANKETKKSSSIQDLSIVDISLGGIPLLALSSDSSTLVACLGGELHFFSTNSLIKKVEKPFMSRSLDASAHVKDFRWDKRGKNTYVALSSSRVLYHGDLQTQHTIVAESVDAVDWADKGDLIAIARMNSIRILSSDFQERCHMPLPFPSLGDDAKTCTIEVDSIRWVCNDSIVIGCALPAEDGMGGGYLIRVITSTGHDIFKASSGVIVSFDSFFLSYNESALPFGRGPLLFMNYLELWELALAANRKSVDDHIVLLGWLEDQNLKEPKVIEFSQDKWMPRIQMKANGDENLVVGFCVDVNVDDGKFEIEIDGGGRKELSYCIMLCLTVDGMLTLFRVARRSAPVTVSQTSKNSAVSTEEHNIKFLEVQHDLGNAALKSIEPTVEAAEVDDKPLQSEMGTIKMSSITRYQKNMVKQSVPVESPVNTPKSAIEISEDSGRSQVHMVKSPERINAAVKLGVQNSAVENANRTSPQVPGLGGFMIKGIQKPFSSMKGIVDMESSVMQNVSLDTNKTSAQNLLKAQGESLVGQRDNGFDVKSSSTGLQHSEFGASAHGYSQFSQKVSPVPPSQKGHAKLDAHLNSHSPVVMDSDDFSKAFENVKEMAKELDCLLSSIEGEGGYMDAATVFQKDSVFTIEESIRSLSKRCRDWKSIMTGRLQDIQLLQNGAMQAIAKEIHMKSIVRQATNNQYWDLWKRQKLRPEFEVKRQRLMKAKQNLINQLIELERHFNALELNKFGDGDIRSKVKAPQASMELSRRGQELQRLYNTMNSQLVTSNQLSESLSKQMSALKIVPCTVKRHETTKELFESIGLAYDGDPFQSPHFKGAGSTLHSNKKPLISSTFSSNMDDHVERTTNSQPEPETTRRRRDSVDKNLVGFEPPKTIVKRMFKEEFSVLTADKFSVGKSKKSSCSEIGRLADHLLSEVSLPLPSTNRNQLNQYSKNEGPESPGMSVLRVHDLPSAFSASSLSILHSRNIDGKINYHGQSTTVPGSRGQEAYCVTKTGPNAQPFNSKSSGLTGIFQNSSKVAEPETDAVHLTSQCISFSDANLIDDQHKYEMNLERDLLGVKSKSISLKDGKTSTIHPVSSVLPAGPSGKTLQSANSIGSVQAAKTLSTEISSSDRYVSSPATETPVSASLVSSSIASSPSSSASISNQALHVDALSSAPVGIPSDASRQSSADTERVQTGKNLLTATISQPTFLISPASAPSIPGFFQSSSSLGPTSAFSSSVHASTPPFLSTAVVPPPTNALSSSSAASPRATPAVISSPVSVVLNLPKESVPPPTVGLLDGHTPHCSQEAPSTSDGLLSDSKSRPEAKVDIQTSSAVLSSSSTFSPPTLQVRSSKLSPQKSDETVISKSDFLPTATIPISGISTEFSLGNPPTLLSAPNLSLFGSSSSVSLSSQQATVVGTSVIENMETAIVQEDEMEEEASDSTTTLNLESFDGFGLGSTISNAPKSNPFVGSFSGSPQVNTGFSMSVPPGELFKPASFSLPSAQPSQLSGSNVFSGAFGGTKNATPANNVFGQPAQIGVAQQALGSVLGSFGQSRQLGVGLPGAGFASSNAFGGGFAASSAAAGGFAKASTGSGFAGAGGFAGVGTGGFSAVASSGGGFAGAASAGGGFAGATGGGFSAFSSKAGGGGFGNTNVTSSPLSDRFTQIRR